MLDEYQCNKYAIKNQGAKTAALRLPEYAVSVDKTLMQLPNPQQSLRKRRLQE